MLHEVLLALSGHPSPLFKDCNQTALPDGTHSGHEDFPLLSPSEKAVLQPIGQLSELHLKLRQHIRRISSNHASTVCRAVATSIQQAHLARFQQKIIDVESKILTKNASMVGAYEIVPLAGVVGEFDDWHRRMAWYWDIARFVQPVEQQTSKLSRCTGAALIEKLRIEQQTGFPDVESAAVELSKVAETAWLRQLASWVLYGKLPAFGADDFFIHATDAEDGQSEHFSKDRHLLPKFITSSTASSVLFIGKSLHQVRKYGRQPRSLSGPVNQPISEDDLASSHLQQIATLSLPIVPAQLSRAVTAIRLSLSQNVLQHLLPIEMTLELFLCLKEFFLLSRSEFAVALISEADGRLQARQQSTGRLLQQDPVKALQSLSIKDAEFHQTLSRTWKILASRDDDTEDSALEFARKHISLSRPTGHDSRPSTSDSVHGATVNLTPIAFNDLLFPSATSLGLNITPPLDLVVSPREMESYSTVNAYLLTIKRAHLRLSDLWRRTSARRDISRSREGSSEAASSDARSRDAKRKTATRKVWATCSAANFLLSETSAYFEGEIIRESWDHFEDWVKQPVSNEFTDKSSVNTSIDSSQGTTQRDPETLAAGHRTFLAALTYALLLNDVPYTRELRSLLGNVDSLIAFFVRLLDIQQKIDVENDAGGEAGYTMSEESRISLELDRARKKVDSDLKSAVNRLRQLDHERIGSARYLGEGAAESGFEPWKGGGVDRLLMKLEFGRIVEDGFDIV